MYNIPECIVIYILWHKISRFQAAVFSSISHGQIKLFILHTYRHTHKNSCECRCVCTSMRVCADVYMFVCVWARKYIYTRKCVCHKMHYGNPEVRFQFRIYLPNRILDSLRVNYFNPLSCNLIIFMHFSEMRWNLF